MTLHPRLNRAGIDLVEGFEGLRRRAARLERGGWTIGYGHTASAREGAEVTAEEAEALLLYDLDKVAKALDGLTVPALNANQFSALTAFAFNIGLENFKTSAVLSRINAGAYLEAAAAIELWRRADVQGDSLVVDALVRRRAAEKALFLTPAEGFRPVPTPVVRADLDDADSDLSGAADLWVSLDGDVAMAERREAGSATTEAANAVTARLQALIPDPELAPAAAGVDVLDEPQAPPPAPEPVVEAEAPPEPAPEALPPEALPPEAPPPEAEEPAPPPLLLHTPPMPVGEDTAFGSLDRSFGHRPAPLKVEPARTVTAPSVVPSKPLSVPAVLLVGLFGSALFVGALAAMVYGKATLTSLAVGILGVVCMAPAALNLLLKLFGERSPDRD